ncbi:MAG: hypothetical protein SchgKO_17400 [Schleiferiaceae bacterium]
MVGVLAMYSPYKEIIVVLSPYNLLLTAFVLFYKRIQKWEWIPLSIVFALGLGVEMLGVNTGFPFGEYQYSSIFGPQIVNTPLLIGLLWALLMYSFFQVLKSRVKNGLVLALLIGMGMTILDFLIEPVAIALNFWSWKDGHPPAVNFTSWFVISFLLTFVLRYFQNQTKYQTKRQTKNQRSIQSREEEENPLALWVLIVQFGFFAALQAL